MSTSGWNRQTGPATQTGGALPTRIAPANGDRERLDNVRSEIVVNSLDAEELLHIKDLVVSLRDFYEATALREAPAPFLGRFRTAEELWHSSHAYYESLLKQGGFVLAADFRGRYVGYCAGIFAPRPWLWEGTEILHMVALGVLPLVGRIAAESLARALERMADDRGVSVWAAMCLATNLSIQRFFEEYGGRPVYVTYHGSKEGSKR